MGKFDIGATFDLETRAQRLERSATPHLGKVHLVTRYTDALAAPLPPVVPA
jgi:hypothetical protein